ncbi:MAG: tRNA A-37 threonylcarbamoyl transferase component Bud32 [Candidatus Azotimanducaceae bacterium]|jgi:tRNA A-37 threonylcarbamoyl transferase component Bud32
MSLNMVSRGLKVAKVAIHANRLRKSTTEEKKRIARIALAGQFADARGSLMKVGQLLSADQDDSFDTLLKGISPLPLDEIIPAIEFSLGQSVDNVFDSIAESNHAASLGQVHQATLKNGQQVAVKVRYPDIVKLVEAEIKIFGLMPGLGPVKKWGMDLESYKQAFKSNMDRELDYCEESKTQQLFRKELTIPGLCIPAVYPESSCSGLIVQSWESGQYLDEISGWPIKDKKKLGEILLTTLFKSLFELGVVHGDPHVGNYYFRRDKSQRPEVVMMDFGCKIEITKNRRLALLNLILAISEERSVIPIRNFASMGFEVTKLAKIGESLPMLSQILFKPFMQPGLFHISHWEIESRVERLLGEKKWWFRSAGPSDLFLLLRAFQGIVQQLQMLKVSLPWLEILHRSLDPEIIQNARLMLLPAIKQEQQIKVSDVRCLASALCIKVSSDGKEKVSARVPAELALDLENLMPSEVLDILRKDNEVDLVLIQRNIADSGVAPQAVFHHEIGIKKYEIWLE